jgi:hypothetical protein
VGHDVVADGAEYRPDESAVSVRTDHQHVAFANVLEQHLGGVTVTDSCEIRTGSAALSGSDSMAPVTAAANTVFTAAAASVNSSAGKPWSGL